MSPWQACEQRAPPSRLYLTARAATRGAARVRTFSACCPSRLVLDLDGELVVDARGPSGEHRPSHWHTVLPLLSPRCVALADTCRRVCARARIFACAPTARLAVAVILPGLPTHTRPRIVWSVATRHVFLFVVSFTPHRVPSRRHTPPCGMLACSPLRVDPGDALLVAARMRIGRDIEEPMRYALQVERVKRAHRTDHGAGGDASGNAPTASLDHPMANGGGLALADASQPIGMMRSPFVVPFRSVAHVNEFPDDARTSFAAEACSEIGQALRASLVRCVMPCAIALAVATHRQVHVPGSSFPGVPHGHAKVKLSARAGP